MCSIRIATINEYLWCILWAIAFVLLCMHLKWLETQIYRLANCFVYLYMQVYSVSVCDDDDDIKICTFKYDWAINCNSYQSNTTTATTYLSFTFIYYFRSCVGYIHVRFVHTLIKSIHNSLLSLILMHFPLCFTSKLVFC